MPDILHRVGIDASPEKVYGILTSLEGNRGWLDREATGEAQKGGTVTFFKGGLDAKVMEAKPNELVVWDCVKGPAEWVGTKINFKLEFKQDQTLVLFAHKDWREPVEFMYHCSMKWAVFLLSLKALAETGKGRPTPDDVWIYVGEGKNYQKR